MSDKKSYYVNMIEAKDGKIKEVLDFNFGGHHDIAAMVEKTAQAENPVHVISRKVLNL